MPEEQLWQFGDSFNYSGESYEIVSYKESKENVVMCKVKSSGRLIPVTIKGLNDGINRMEYKVVPQHKIKTSIETTNGFKCDIGDNLLRINGKKYDLQNYQNYYHILM